MTFVNVKPVPRKQRVVSDFDRIFNDFFNSGSPTTSFHQNKGLNAKPATNVIENNGAFRIELAAPGLEKNDFKIDVEKNILHIEVNKEGQNIEGETFKRREFGSYNFKRSFQLPKSIDTEKIEASYLNGLLVIHLPKKEEAKEKPARSIAIQ